MVEEKKEKKKRKTIEEKDKRFVCNVCGKKCANPQSLRMHKKWKHSDSGGESFRKPEDEKGGGDDGTAGCVPRFSFF